MLTPSRIVEEAEAKSALAGLHALAKYYSGPLILEMDCHAITKELAAGDQSRSQCYALIKDIKQALSVFSATRNVSDQEIIANVPDKLCPLMMAEFVYPLE